MPEKKEKKALFSSYISKEVNEVAEYLIRREEISKVVFVRRAIRSFMDSDQVVEPRVKITKRSDPDYIKKESLFVTYIEEKQKEQLKSVAAEQGCTLSQVFFQTILHYCAVLISLDDTGLQMKEEDEG